MHRAALSVAVFFSSLALAAPPRIVPQPIVAQAELPPGANRALLTSLARLSLVLPSSFEVEDALAALPTRTCAMDASCLAGLARATGAGWALAVSYREAEGRPVLSAQVISSAGEVSRSVEASPGAALQNDAQWLEAFTALVEQLQLERLGEVVSPPAVAEVNAPPKSTPTVRLPAAPPPRPTWPVPVAVVAGLVAVGAGGAATALAFTNLKEANALEAAKREGLIPANAVDRAVSLDERTVAATALGIGAGVAGVVAVVALVSRDAPPPVQLAPSVGAGTAGVVLSGRFP